MKNNLLRTLCAVTLLLPVLWSCQRERIADEVTQNTSLAPQGAIGDIVCGAVREVPLAEGNGNLLINYCSDGISQIPCGPNPDAWGTISYFKSTPPGSNTASLNLDVSLGLDWYATGYQVIANFGSITPAGNLPTPNQTWASNELIPARSQFLIDLPLSTSGFGAGCLEWTIIINATMVDINGTPIPGSARTLYAYDPAGQGSPFAIDACYAACPSSNITTLSKGSCQGCRSRVTTTFTGCSSVDISACKNIRRVVVVYDDCTRQVFANLNVPTFSVPYNGKNISHVFVRSGCKNNDDDQGNDDGPNGSNSSSSYKRFRFNAPCQTGGC